MPSIQLWPKYELNDRVYNIQYVHNQLQMTNYIWTYYFGKLLISVKKLPAFNYRPVQTLVCVTFYHRHDDVAFCHFNFFKTTVVMTKQNNNRSAK